MRRPSPLRATALVLGLAAAAAAGPRTPSPWAAGEELQFTVSLGIFPEAARITLETLEPVPAGEKGRLRLRGEVRPGSLMGAIYPFFYSFLTTVSLPAMLPVRGSRRIEEGAEREFYAVDFDHPAREVRFALRAGEKPIHVQRIEADTRDLLAAIYHLRGLPPGAEARFSALVNRRLYPVHIRPEESERIDGAMGSTPARRYRVDVGGKEDGEPPIRELLVWISDDDRALPLRLEAATPLGSLVIQLTDARSTTP